MTLILGPALVADSKTETGKYAHLRSLANRVPQLPRLSIQSVLATLHKAEIRRSGNIRVSVAEEHGVSILVSDLLSGNSSRASIKAIFWA